MALALYRSAFGTLALVAVGVQLSSGAAEPSFSLVNFLSFFTILGNLYAAAIFLLGAVRWRTDRADEAWELARGAAVVYLAVTGVVFAVLLSGIQEQLQLTIPWVDTVLHRVMPVVVVADWLIDPPRHRLTVRHSLVWLAFPAVWLAYTLARGPIVDWYPYPFLDPIGGYGTVAAYCIAILVGFALACAIVVAVPRLAASR